MQLIIPALNEERRLPATLAKLRSFVETSGALDELEVIVVDNASSDATAAVARACDSEQLPVRVVSCPTRGKGAAVRAGILASTHAVVGYLDADGATDLSALLAARDLVEDGVDLAIGSRAVDGSVTFDRHSRVRAQGARAYRFWTRQVAPGVMDTQCGFKLMSGDLARRIFEVSRCHGFSFDVEVIGRFQQEGVRIVEFPVVWVDVPGSTFVPARHGLGAFASLVPIALRLRGLAASAVGDAQAGSHELEERLAAPEVSRPLELRGARVAVLNWRDPWHSHAGGSERYAWHCAAALRDAGAHVDFVAARDEHQTTREQRDGIAIRRGGRQYSYYPFAWRYLLWRRLTGRAYDVVIDTEAGIPVFSPPLLARRTPVVLIVHHVHRDQFATYLPRPLALVARMLEAQLMPLVYRNVTTFAVSESTRKEMARQLGWTRPVRIVHNGADAPGPAVTSRRADQLVVLSRLTTHKRIDLVIRAVDRLRAERPALRLDIVGKGVDHERLAALVARSGLDGVVTMHGYLDEQRKRAVVGSASLHVCASDIEGWGQAVIEAAALGVPTLARDVPGLRDSIRDGETGWLVTSADGSESEVLDALVAGLRSSLARLEDPSARAELAESCRTWAGKFSWSAMHEEVVSTVAGQLRFRHVGTRPGRRAPQSVSEQERSGRGLLACRRRVGRT